MAGEYGTRSVPRGRSEVLARTPPLRWGLLVGLGFALVAVATVAVWQIRLVVMLLIAATFVAIGLDAPVRWLIRRGLSRGVAVLIVVLTGVLGLFGVLALLIPAVVTEGTQFFRALPGMVDAVMSSPPLAKLGSKSELAEAITSSLSPQAVAAAIGGVLGGAASLAGTIVALGTVAVLAMFILSGFDRLRGNMHRLVPASRRDTFGRIVDQILAKIGAYLVGVVSIAVVAGVSASVFMLIAGIPYAVLLGLVVAILDLIPQIGATIGACVVVAVALSESVGQAIAALVFFVLYQQIENWVIYPRVMRQAVELSNLATITAILIGGALFGVLGVLIAVPAYAAVQLLIREFVLPRLDAA